MTSPGQKRPEQKLYPKIHYLDKFRNYPLHKELNCGTNKPHLQTQTCNFILFIEHLVTESSYDNNNNKKKVTTRLFLSII